MLPENEFNLVISVFNFAVQLEANALAFRDIFFFFFVENLPLALLCDLTVFYFKFLGHFYKFYYDLFDF